jgi:hypothetical protein
MWATRGSSSRILPLVWDWVTTATRAARIAVPPIPEINAAFPGYGNAVKQANMNLAPQIGFAWDPRKNGKSAIRRRVGLFYENVIWNNVLFDRPERLRSGAFMLFQTLA